MLLKRVNWISNKKEGRGVALGNVFFFVGNFFFCSFGRGGGQQSQSSPVVSKAAATPLNWMITKKKLPTVKIPILLFFLRTSDAGDVTFFINGKRHSGEWVLCSCCLQVPCSGSMKMIIVLVKLGFSSLLCVMHTQPCTQTHINTHAQTHMCVCARNNVMRTNLKWGSEGTKKNLK